MAGLEPGLKGRPTQLRVRTNNPDDDTLLLHNIPADARSFNKPQISVLVKRPRAGLPFLVCVDEDLEYPAPTTNWRGSSPLPIRAHAFKLRIHVRAGRAKRAHSGTSRAHAVVNPRDCASRSQSHGGGVAARLGFRGPVRYERKLRSAERERTISAGPGDRDLLSSRFAARKARPICGTDRFQRV